jgi:hypothetical protein
MDWGWRAGTVQRVLSANWSCRLRVSSPTLSATNVEKDGHSNRCGAEKGWASPPVKFHLPFGDAFRFDCPY